MITTQSAYRHAITETQVPSYPLPLFSLPHGSAQYREVNPQDAMSELTRARAGFVWKNVAAILD